MEWKLQVIYLRSLSEDNIFMLETWRNNNTPRLYFHLLVLDHIWLTKKPKGNSVFNCTCYQTNEKKNDRRWLAIITLCSLWMFMYVGTLSSDWHRNGCCWNKENFLERNTGASISVCQQQIWLSCSWFPTKTHLLPTIQMETLTNKFAECP